jgi:hypothetical protein
LYLAHKERSITFLTQLEFKLKDLFRVQGRGMISSSEVSKKPEEQIEEDLQKLQISAGNIKKARKKAKKKKTYEEFLIGNVRVKHSNNKGRYQVLYM